MPKGKTNQPLIVMIPEEWRDVPPFDKMAGEGHELVNLPPECLKVDIIFSPNSHRMTKSMMGKKGMILVAKKAARKAKKEKS